MSIKNLTTELNKEDQQLNVTNITTNNLDLQFNSFPALDFNFSDTVEIEARSGYVQFTNIPNILSGTRIGVTLNYPQITPTDYCVVVTGDQLGSVENAKLSCDVFSVTLGTINISFYNHSTTTFTGTDIAFSYLIIKGFI